MFCDYSYEEDEGDDYVSVFNQYSELVNTLYPKFYLSIGYLYFLHIICKQTKNKQPVCKLGKAKQLFRLVTSIRK